MERTATIAFIALAGGCVAGCFGGGGGGGGGLVPTTASPGGIWQGTDTRAGQQVAGLVAETGQFNFRLADGALYIGTVTVSGTTGSGSFEGFAPLGTTFADGSTHGTGSVSGNVQERASFTATTQFRTDGGTSYTDTLSLTFNSLYNRASSLTTIAGNFAEAGTGTVFSVTGTGTIFAQDATSGCVINGAVSIINAAYNAYGVSVVYELCTGQYAVLNGVQLTGIGALDNSVSPERAIITLTGAAGATKIAFVEVLNRT
jgi:hypothetical protein